MNHQSHAYINGEWVDTLGQQEMAVINPATEQTIATIKLGNAEDVDRAVKAARKAFETYSQTTREERMAMLTRIIDVYQTRMDDIATVVSQEMGAPIKMSKMAQAPSGLGHFKQALRALEKFEFQEDGKRARMLREPIGVCGLITPWNWPLNQIAAKVAPALAAGCTVVLKPSEIAPLNALLFAEVMHEAGVPAGVFNLINGDGPGVGVAMSSHPDIDMISFTGSTRAGVSVAQEAAPSVKRVAQELGGKSPNIILDGADFEKVVARDTFGVCMNTGQSCNAPTRMLVPMARMDEAAAIAAATAAKMRVGNPADEKTQIGPLVSENQFKKVQGLIQQGIDEGAKLVAGGTGRPDGLDSGYFVRPTVFANVTNDMTIAREEIFGPVLSLIGYTDEEDAIRIANDTPYGLSAYVTGADIESAARVGARLRAGNVHLNGAGVDPSAPFGGYKQSGNGREFGKWGLEEFLETKAMLGYHEG
ncbi:MAG: aldehyde dehydrogenase family protein [Burkholderiaceae bacterium]